MATWQDVKAYIHANHSSAEDVDADHVRFGWEMDGNRTQMVVLSNQLNGEAVIVTSGIGEIDQLDLRKLLMMTNETLFSVACMGTLVVMQQLLNTATLDAEELNIAIGPMAAVADAFERELTGKDVY